MNANVSVIGAAVIDIIAGSVDKDIFIRGSVPARSIGMSFGGDALNEAVILAGLGMKTELISLLGNDESAKSILKYLSDNKVDSSKISTEPDICTGMNIVLVDKEAERYFITNPDSSLRKLSKKHILPYINDLGNIISFASIFVSYALPISDMAEVFKAAKQTKGRILVADMTTAKNGETIKDLAPILEYVDYIIPNEKEAAILTQKRDPKRSAECFLEHGAHTVIIKCGKNGCFYKNKNEEGIVHAFRDARAIDTTGAGDSFVSGFIYGLSKNLSLQECCRYGCAVSSVAVEHYGTGCIEEIINESEKRFKNIDADENGTYI